MTVVLECQNIFKNFGGLTALADINFQVKQGDTLGIIGPNGAGKTTLFNIIAGAVRPSEGKVLFKDRDITGLGRDRICRMGLARSYQLVRPFPSLSTLENVLVGVCFGRGSCSAGTSPRQLARDELEFVGLGHKADHRAETLTLAEKRRLEIARCLATDPALLLLDEVVSGLTPAETGDMIRIVKEIRARGVTVVMIEHVLRVVTELCATVVVLRYGAEIAKGTPADVMDDPRVMEACLGAEVG